MPAVNLTFPDYLIQLRAGPPDPRPLSDRGTMPPWPAITCSKASTLRSEVIRISAVSATSRGEAAAIPPASASRAWPSLLPEPLRGSANRARASPASCVVSAEKAAAGPCLRQAETEKHRN